MVREPPHALSEPNGDGGGDPRRRAWVLVRDAYLEAAALLRVDDADRVLMLRQGRRVAEIAGLPWRVLQAPARARRDS